MQPKCDEMEVDFKEKDTHYEKRKKEIIGMSMILNFEKNYIQCICSIIVRRGRVSIQLLVI